jgi:NADPH:quinone reductase-like Zn-dependent oxidoreductase
VVTPAEDFPQQVAAITGGGGAHAAVDPVSGDGAAALGAALRPGGRVFIYGSMAGSPDFKGSGIDLMFR